jgi:hypothetical protein
MTHKRAKRPPAKLSERGRKAAAVASSYAPSRHPEAARRLVALGATDWDIAQAFGVTMKMLWRWKLEHDKFAQALAFRDEDAVFQNDRVKRSLLHRATGYSYHAEKIVVVEGEVVRVPTIEHVPPAESSMRFWLQNRDPERWNAAHNVNLHASATLDVTITKDTSPKDALGAFMKMLGAPAASLAPALIEHEPEAAKESPGERRWRG